MNKPTQAQKEFKATLEEITFWSLFLKDKKFDELGISDEKENFQKLEKKFYQNSEKYLKLMSEKGLPAPFKAPEIKKDKDNIKSKDDFEAFREYLAEKNDLLSKLLRQYQKEATSEELKEEFQEILEKIAALETPLSIEKNWDKLGISKEEGGNYAKLYKNFYKNSTKYLKLMSKKGLPIPFEAPEITTIKSKKDFEDFREYVTENNDLLLKSLSEHQKEEFHETLEHIIVLRSKVSKDKCSELDISEEERKTFKKLYEENFLPNSRKYLDLMSEKGWPAPFEAPEIKENDIKSKDDFEYFREYVKTKNDLLSELLRQYQKEAASEASEEKEEKEPESLKSDAGATSEEFKKEKTNTEINGATSEKLEKEEEKEPSQSPRLVPAC